MNYIIIGLGNPGEEYENTRHNTGRFMVEAFAKANDFSDFVADKKLKALVSSGSVSPSSPTPSLPRGSAESARRGSSKISLVLPETFMNKSGDALKQIQDLRFKIQGKGKDKITEVTNLAVVHDDLDIPFGKFKISWNKSSGGHRGVESIIKALKTQAFVRIRVGIASSAAAVKKSQDESAVDKIILGTFKPPEMDELKKLSKKISETLAVLITSGREKAMSQCN